MTVTFQQRGLISRVGGARLCIGWAGNEKKVIPAVPATLPSAVVFQRCEHLPPDYIKNYFPSVPVAGLFTPGETRPRTLSPTSWTFSAIELRFFSPLAGANKIPRPIPIPIPAAKWGCHPQFECPDG